MKENLTIRLNPSTKNFDVIRVGDPKKESLGSYHMFWHANMHVLRVMGHTLKRSDCEGCAIYTREASAS